MRDGTLPVFAGPRCAQHVGLDDVRTSVRAVLPKLESCRRRRVTRVVRGVLGRGAVASMRKNHVACLRESSLAPSVPRERGASEPAKSRSVLLADTLGSFSLLLSPFSSLRPLPSVSTLARPSAPSYITALTIAFRIPINAAPEIRPAQIGSAHSTQMV